MSFGDSVLIVPAAAIPLVIAFGAVVAAAVGSFLNVVIYRLPRRQSLIRPASRCPHCDHPIRWYDNVPVAGWILLGGRCRDCHARISPRYPAIEALMAALGGLLAWKDVLVPIDSTGADFLVELRWLVFHLLLVCTLVCAAAIEFDGLVPPRRLLQFPALVGAAMLLIWRDLLWPGDVIRFAGLPAAMSGAAMGLLLGLAPCLAMLTNTQGARGRYALVALGELMLVGFFVGDHAIVPVALETMALYVATQLAARLWPVAGRFGWAGPLLLTSVLWLAASPDAVPFDPLLSSEFVLRAGLAIAIMTALVLVLQIVPPPKRSIERVPKQA